MRFARLPSLLILLLAALLPGCGGNQISAEEVPVDPPTLTIPSNPDAAPGASTADTDDANADEDADADDAEPTATADPAASSGSGSTGGSAPTATPTAAAPTATAPPEDTGGATADEGLDQFCADNPGAC